jgi:hypothetical protein
MKKLMSLMLGLSLVIGAASVAFAAHDDDTTKKSGKKKKKKSGGGTMTPKTPQ